MDRTPEPPFGSAQEAQLYSEADFSEANAALVERIASFCHAAHPATVLDIGCGPGDIAIGLARTFPHARIIGLDPWPAMIQLAQARVDEARLGDRIVLERGTFPTSLNGQRFDLLVCASTFHHFPDPEIFWQGVRDFSAPGGTIAVWDLIRPASEADAVAIVESAAKDAPPLLKRDFMQSLCASYRIEEVNEQLSTKGLPIRARQGSERHWLVLDAVGN